MRVGIVPPAQADFGPIPGPVLYSILHLIGISCFIYIVVKRLQPLLLAAPDRRFDQPWARLALVGKYWFGQWKHPRYRLAGTLHILIFVGFLILIARAVTLLIQGVDGSFTLFSGRFGEIYGFVKDYASTMVFLCMVFAAVRRIVFKPERYAVPPEFGKWRSIDAILLLGLIAILMLSDGLFEASKAAGDAQEGKAGEIASLYSLPWLLREAFLGLPMPVLSFTHHGAYMLHEFAFFFLLCYRPFGIQFHVESSLFSVYFAKLDRSRLKPVRWDVPEDGLDTLPSLGVKTFTDFTWKQILDSYSCADCGRCSDQCPAHAVQRPLSPRLLTLKSRDYAFRHYPVFSRAPANGAPLAGSVFTDDEIWSCTTCGACEEECPLLVEYIDKIVDLRRGLVDDGKVPQSLQKPLKSLESRGNPYGKVEKKRGDWTRAKEFQPFCSVRILTGDQPADTLYFVDSITSFDDRIQRIGQATSKVLTHIREDFGILGPAEKDSGHEVRRFGEETLFLALRDANTEAIKDAGIRRIVTSDPHAYNALKHDYPNVPPVEHISQVMAQAVDDGTLQFKPVECTSDVYTYHDPCYLGRHNRIFDEPRRVLDAIPALHRVEMPRCRDRSFCCGGGGLALFYEPKEEERMGVLRVKMAAAAGANVIVTACPFCMVNVEDAIKVSGMEGKMAVVDLAELVERQMLLYVPHARRPQKFLS